GYSYLVFRIIFPPKSSDSKIPLTPKALMDWNNNLHNKQEYELKLVVRQNLSQSLFQIQIEPLFGKVKTENNYPFGYNRFGSKNGQNNLEYKTLSEWNSSDPIKYDYNAFPKAYGDPITAIEAPWRIILSPKLPHQDKFKF